MVLPHDGTETELKFRVSDERAFTALAAAARRPLPSPTVQINHFFDSPDFRLSAARYAVRLREEHGSFVLCAKGPERTSEDGTLTSRSEEEVQVDADAAAAILEGRASALAILTSRADARSAPLLSTMNELAADVPLVQAGSFRNERARLPITLNVDGAWIPFEFELDRTTFPGGRTDYEIEVELRGADTRAAAAAVRAFLTAAGIEGHRAPSKAKRLFDIVAARGQRG
jgi:uncharacterized protein YjbK